MPFLKQLVADNLPSAKPELWENAPRVLWRRFAGWMNTRLDPAWPSRPFISTVEPEGLMLEIVPGGVIGKPIAYFGVYEFAVSKLVRDYLKAGDVFVDVGANIGYYSVIAGALVGPTGRVHAFEPSARIRARLERNVKLNGLDQVRVRAEAVSRQSGTVRLVEPTNTENDGLAYVDTTAGGAGREVPAIRLDECDELRSVAPALIKVDVEGGEPDVFQGASGLFSEPEAPSILFESFEIRRDAAILQAFGYEIFRPTLRSGALGLSNDIEAPPYRRWEAPNFLAVKTARGPNFAARLSM